MIDLLAAGYFIIILLVEILKIAFYGAGLWMCLKLIKDNQ